MNNKMDMRLRAIEAAQSSVESSLERALDAAAFDQKILTLADRFAAEDADIAPAERMECFSPAMRLAWALRFGCESDRAVALDEARRNAGP